MSYQIYKRQLSLLLALAIAVSQSLNASAKPWFLASLRDSSASLPVAERRRKYWLHVPRSYRGSEPVPLVIVLHGGGGNHKFAANMGRFNEKSEKEGFIVA